MSNALRFNHLHITRLVHYEYASKIQGALVKRLLDRKKSQSQPETGRDDSGQTILTFQFHPVYTCGRREVSTITEEQIRQLRGTDHPESSQAEFHTALRGGQTTFHGPGQLVAYPIIDLKHVQLSPRDYIGLLENTTIKVCSYHDVYGKTTENPGVWVEQKDGSEKKIAAVGVHMRRNITSHGIGFNVNTDLGWFDRAVMCGLEGKSATSLAEETGKCDLDVTNVAKQWVSTFVDHVTSGKQHSLTSIAESQVGQYLESSD